MRRDRKRNDKTSGCIFVPVKELELFFKAEGLKLWRARQTLGSSGPKGHAEPSRYKKAQIVTYEYASMYT